VAALETVLERDDSDSSSGWGMWRWEVSAWTHLLPPDTVPKVKCARAARKRWSQHMTALVQLLAALNTADQALNDTATSTPKRDAALAQVGPAHEKVLKLEREAVTHRLAEAARLQKAAAVQALKEQQLAEKVQAKERKKLEALQAKERKKQEAEAAKLLKKKSTSATKTAAREKEAVEQQAQVELARQKTLRSFFTSAPVGAADKECRPVSSSSTKDAAIDLMHTSPLKDPSSKCSGNAAFDVNAFRATIGSHSTDRATLARDISSRLRRERPKRRRSPRAKTVSVPVMVTVYPEGYEENPFSFEQPYTEQQYVSVANKYKFLSFFENTRPAYFGTWSKQSRSISGRTPMAQDTQFLNYEVDSEEEWEADVDNAEDCEEDDGNRSVDSNCHDEEDGWLAAEDVVEYEGQEEEASARPAGPLDLPSTTKRATPSRFVISTYLGRPLSLVSPDSTAFSDRIEGFSIHDAQEYLAGFFAVQLHDHELHLDAFPPSLVDEHDATTDQPTTDKSTMPVETMKEFARFVHNCTLGSRDKVVDEFLKGQKSTASSSRAQVYRVLDSFADKKRHPRGVVWQVKKDVLTNLGLEELADTTDQTVEDVQLEAMKAIATFVHHHPATSKEKLVDDLRAKHESVTSSRADAMRILQSIATKEKHAKGYYWSVKKEVLHELGLDELANRPL
jgi:chromatin assembly factor 1 subunit A